MQILREFDRINPDFTTASITDLWEASVTAILELSQSENDAAVNTLMDESGTEFSDGKYSCMHYLNTVLFACIYAAAYFLVQFQQAGNDHCIKLMSDFHSYATL